MARVKSGSGETARVPARLCELAVRDLALVSELRLDLAPGLVVLTGETGAGKSMLVDALLAATGGRVGADLIRQGAARAQVELTVEPLPAALRARLEQEEIDDLDGAVVLAREIAPGRAPARVAGRSVAVGLLAEVGEALIAVHGQHGHLRLAKPAVQRDLLDAFGGHADLAAEAARLHAALLALRRERETLGGDPRERERRADLLRHEIEQIDEAGLTPDEEERLAERLGIARSSERIRAAVEMAHAALMTDDEGARDRAGRALAALRQAAMLDPRLTQTLTDLTLVIEQLEDISSRVSDHLERIDIDPEELARLERREDDLERLRRRYGATVIEILAYAEQARAELAALEAAGGRLAALDAEEARLTEERRIACERLSKARAAAAKKLAKAVEAELADLALERCRFSVAIEPQDPDGSGVDRVRFLVAPNPGEPAAPIEDIASGGELARIMLAIEVALAAKEGTPVLVFDEVDSGVGGRLGEVLGRKLWALARDRQVLCVSHLPQLAAYADQHIRVRKETVDGRTHVRADDLRGEARTDETAAMLGGEKMHAAAEGLLRDAETWRRSGARAA